MLAGREKKGKPEELVVFEDTLMFFKLPASDTCFWDIFFSNSISTNSPNPG